MILYDLHTMYNNYITLYIPAVNKTISHLSCISLRNSIKYGLSINLPYLSS